jgi:hypothetical protein
MSMLGRGSYAFEGDPFEYVYAEIKGSARVTGTTEFEENQLEIENHLVTTVAQADAVAFQNLFRAQADKNPREVSMIHDVGLEANDIFEFGDDGRRYLATTISRKLSRDPKRAVATVQALEITSTVSIGT